MSLTLLTILFSIQATLQQQQIFIAEVKPNKHYEVTVNKHQGIELSFIRLLPSSAPSPSPTQFGAELVIFPFNPATQPPIPPTYQKSSF